jgi:phosphatidylglycerol:prolipoprotein diacylglycerol transferase
MILAEYLHNLDPFALRIGPNFGIRWYGLAYVVAFLVGYWLYKRLARQGYSVLKPEQVGDFITWAALLGVFLGGRLGYFLLYSPETLVTDPLAFFQVWKGGMASHGGIAALILFTLWYSWRHRVSWLNIGDNLVVVAPLGLFFGRLANFVNGELYGRITDSSWGMKFPSELESASVMVQERVIDAARAIDSQAGNLPQIIERARSNPALANVLSENVNIRHPSQLYEAAAEGLLLFGILWLLRTCWPFHKTFPRTDRPPRGFLTAMFFILYAAARIACERFREPDASLFGPFTRGQFYSFLMVAAGIAFLVASIILAKKRSATAATMKS